MSLPSPRSAVAHASARPRVSPLLAFLLCSALAIALAGGVGIATAAVPDPAGRVTVVLGTVEAIAPDGTVRTLSRQDPVFEGDTLRSGPRGRAQVRFTDRSLLSLRPDTEISIDDYEFDASNTSVASQDLNLRGGGFRKLTGAIADRDRSAYRVRTPLAVIGVRGTIYDVFQQRGGPLLLGVGRGSISAESTSGQTALLGEDAGFNFARVNVDGSVDYLIQVPTELDASPTLDEGDEGDGGGSEDGDGGTGGSAEDSSVATGGGDAGNTAGTQSSAGSQTAQTVNNPNNNNAIAPAQDGQGGVPTTNPVPVGTGPVFTAAQREALLAGTESAILVGAAEELTGGGVGVGSGIGVIGPSGRPLLAGNPGGFSAAAGARQADLESATRFLKATSGAPGAAFGGQNIQPGGGVAGVTWGSFSQPAIIFTNRLDQRQRAPAGGLPQLLFALGTPTPIAALTGTRTYTTVLDAAFTTRSGFVFNGLDTATSLDLGSGDFAGFLDVFLAESGTPTTSRYQYQGEFFGGVLGGRLNVTDASVSLLDLQTEASLVADGDVTGFVTGADAQFLNLGFGYFSPAVEGAGVSGLVLLQSAIAPPVLTAAQRATFLGAGTVALQAGFSSTATIGQAGSGAALGVIDTVGGPIIVGLDSPDFPGAPSTFDRAALLDGTNLIYTSASSATLTQQNDVQGFAGLTWGSFGAPITEFTNAADNSANFVNDRDIIYYAVATPTDVATLTGTASFTSVDFLASTSGLTLNDVFASADVDFASGSLTGILDVLLADPTNANVLFDYLVDFESQFAGGVLTATNVTNAILLDRGAGVDNAANAEISGFFTGAGGAGLQLSFGYSSGARADADVAGLVLLRSDVPQALIPGFDRDVIEVEPTVVVGAGVSSVDSDPDGAPVDDPAGVGSGIGASVGGIEPFVVIPAGDLSTFPTGFAGLDRGAIIDGSTEIFTPDSGAVTLLSADTGGVPGLDWYEFAAPITAFGDAADASVSELIDDDFILVAFGAPRDIADLTGIGFFQSTTFEARTSGALVDDVLAELQLNFDTGALDGILDVQVSNPVDPTAPFGVYIVDFTGQLEGGVITSATIDPGSSFDISGRNGQSFGATADITGFLTGDAGDAFQLSFGFFNPVATGSDVAGLALLRSGLAPTQRLQPAERIDLSRGFGYVQASCCFVAGTQVFKGPTTDPRPSLGQEFLLGGGGASALDPAINDLAPNDIIIRPNLGVVQNFDGALAIGTNTELASFGVMGSATTPLSIYEASTGALIRNIENDIFLLTGRLADPASLVGTGRFELAQITQGAFRNASGTISGSLIDPVASAGSRIEFNVDFANGDIFGGLLQVFTDVDDVGLPAVVRDRIESNFTGTTGVANGNAFFDVFLTSGIYRDSDADAGGSGFLAPQPTTAMTGLFAGDGDTANVAFSFTTESDPSMPSAFLEPIGGALTAVLTQQDLSLQAAEAAQLSANRVFVAVECCDFLDDFVRSGLSGDPGNNIDPITTNGDFILAQNTDIEGVALGPNDAGFLDPSVELIVRPGSARTFYDPSFVAAAMAPELEIAAGSWTTFSGPGASFGVSPAGDIIERIDSQLLFISAVPSDVATLQGAGFTTFAGNSRPDAMGLNSLGGFAASNLASIDPGANVVAGATVSFNVDLASGAVINGHLFGVTEIDPVTSEEFGFELFFDGQIAYANGNTFVDANIIDGVYDEQVAIDFPNSDLQFFFGGAGNPNPPVAGATTGLFAVGAYSLVSQVDANEPNPGQVIGRGTFNIGNSLLPENRLMLAEAQAIAAPTPNGGVRLGLAAFSRLDFASIPAPDIDLPIGAEGLLIGRASDPNTGDFLLGANALYVRPDPMMGFVETNTARRDFFQQPYDFLFRRDGGMTSQTILSTDAKPMGGPTFAGFEITWGRWNGIGQGDGTGAAIFGVPTDNTDKVVVDREVFFASVNPTPQSQMPIIGNFTYAYSGIAMNGAFIGSGQGDISGNFLPVTIDTLNVSFDVDFASGNITNGAFDATYLAMSAPPITWNVGFDGFVNGSIADLSVNSLSILDDMGVQIGGPTSSQIGPPTPVGFPFDSNIGGVFTGPSGERFLGGFNFTAESLASPGFFESIQGAFTADRMGPPL